MYLNQKFIPLNPFCAEFSWLIYNKEVSEDMYVYVNLS
jgi:hypothetical protein